MVLRPLHETTQDRWIDGAEGSDAVPRFHFSDVGFHRLPWIHTYLNLFVGLGTDFGCSVADGGIFLLLIYLHTLCN
jgi:hypothetical protein